MMGCGPPTYKTQIKQSMKQGKDSILSLFRPQCLTYWYIFYKATAGRRSAFYVLIEKEMILYLPIIREFLNCFPDTSYL